MDAFNAEVWWPPPPAAAADLPLGFLPLHPQQTAARLEATVKTFREHTNALSEARKDLHSIFRRLKCDCGGAGGSVGGGY